MCVCVCVCVCVCAYIGLRKCISLLQGHYLIWPISCVTSSPYSNARVGGHSTATVYMETSRQEVTQDIGKKKIMSISMPGVKNPRGVQDAVT